MNFKELVFTVITFYILFRIFRPNVKIFHYHHRAFDDKNHQFRRQRQQGGKITVDKMPKNKVSEKKNILDNSEYVDFEEIK